MTQTRSKIKSCGAERLTSTKLFSKELTRKQFHPPIKQLKLSIWVVFCGLSKSKIFGISQAKEKMMIYKICLCNLN